MILKSFRNASNGIFIKILFGAIIFSFAIWGIGDIIRNYAATRTVVTVGKMKLPSDIFMMELSNKKQEIRSANPNMSPAEFEKIDFKELVINEFISKAVFSQAQEKFKIAVSKGTVFDFIKSTPELQTKGQFDQRKYQTMLYNLQMTEGMYLNKMHSFLASSQLTHPLASGYITPGFINDSLIKDFAFEKDIKISILDVNSLKLKEDVKENEIKAFYNENVKHYEKPEVRDVSILVIDTQKVADEFDITDEEVETFYNENTSEYGPKELRDVEILVFEDSDSAHKAWKMMNVEDATTKQIEKDFAVKAVRENGLDRARLPQKLAEILFRIEKGNATEPLAVEGGVVVYRVVDINQKDAVALKDAKQEIIEQIKSEKMNSPEAHQRVKELRNSVDDALGSGKTMDEISKETGMKVVDIHEFTQASAIEALKDVASDEATVAEIVDETFKTEIGTDTATIDSKEIDTLSFVVRVNNIKKAYVPAFEEIKDKVKEDVIFDKKDKLAQKEIKELKKKGADAYKDLRKFGGKPEQFTLSKIDLLMNARTTKYLSLFSKCPNLDFIFGLLSAKKGEILSTPDGRGNYILASLTNVHKKELSFQDETQINQALKVMYNDKTAIDMIEDGLKTIYKTKIRVDFINKMTSQVEED